MFWLIKACALLAPIPKPTTAMFTVSLGAWIPWPSTCRGTMVIAAPAPATVLTNLRLEMSPIVLPFLESQRS